jgi:glycosyltransferase involved in cell wall biosynthesis
MALNILLTIHHYLDENAGAPGVVCQLSREYAKLGHQTHIYSLDDVPEWLPEKAKMVTFSRFAARYVGRLSQKQRIDVVDASSGAEWLRGMTSNPHNPLLVARSHGLAHTLHLELLEEARRGNVRISWKYPLYHGGTKLWMETQANRRADLALFLNRHDLGYAVNELGVRPERASIVPIGIPDAFLNLPFSATPTAQDAPIRIAQVGTYILTKGIKYAAAALNAFLARNPTVQITFLGTGCPPNLVLSDYDTSLHSRINVIPRYVRDELPELLKGHHIKLFPTLTEGLGLALVEAMACGLAPVVTSVPGPLEVVREGHDALVVPARDSGAIGRALTRMITDTGLLDRLRRNAYATAQAYNWSRVAQQTIRLYEEFMPNPTVPKM